MSFSRIFSILDSLISFLLDGCVFDVALKKVTSHLTKVIQRNIIPAHSSHSSSLNKSNQAKHHSSSMISASGIFFKLFPFHQLAYSRLAGKKEFNWSLYSQAYGVCGNRLLFRLCSLVGRNLGRMFLGEGGRKQSQKTGRQKKQRERGQERYMCGGKKKGFRIDTVL